MNINIFFSAISAILLVIFLLFKPLDIKKQMSLDIPLLQLDAFTMHKLNSTGLVTLLKGSSALRYSKIYKITDVDYTDNSKAYVANITAKKGIYKTDSGVLNLKGDVLYNREDGVILETDEATYNQKTSIAHTDRDYVLYRGKNRVIGSSLIYNNNLNKIASKNITAIYQVKE